MQVLHRPIRSVLFGIIDTWFSFFIGINELPLVGCFVARLTQPALRLHMTSRPQRHCEERSNPRLAGPLCKFDTVLFALYSSRLLRCAAHTTRLAPRNDVVVHFNFVISLSKALDFITRNDVVILCLVLLMYGRTGDLQII